MWWGYGNIYAVFEGILTEKPIGMELWNGLRFSNLFFWFSPLQQRGYCRQLSQILLWRKTSRSGRWFSALVLGRFFTTFAQIYSVLTSSVALSSLVATIIRRRRDIWRAFRYLKNPKEASAEMEASTIERVRDTETESPNQSGFEKGEPTTLRQLRPDTSAPDVVFSNYTATHTWQPNSESIRYNFCRTCLGVCQHSAKHCYFKSLSYFPFPLCVVSTSPSISDPVPSQKSILDVSTQHTPWRTPRFHSHFSRNPSCVKNIPRNKHTAVFYAIHLANYTDSSS
jgi:hypothetical protein